MASRGRGRRGRPRGTGQAPPAFDQQAFAETIRIAVVAIAQACTIVRQGRSNDLQRLEAHHPPMVREGVDSKVRMTMTTEGDVDVMRGIQDMGAGTQRKGDQSSSSSRKKPKASGSQGTNVMFPLPAARTHEEGLPSEARILRFGDSAVPVNCRTGADTIHSSTT